MSMDIVFGLATIYLLTICYKVAVDDCKFYGELDSDHLTNQEESV